MHTSKPFSIAFSTQYWLYTTLLLLFHSLLLKSSLNNSNFFIDKRKYVLLPEQFAYHLCCFTNTTFTNTAFDVSRPYNNVHIEFIGCNVKTFRLPVYNHPLNQTDFPLTPLINNIPARATRFGAIIDAIRSVIPVNSITYSIPFVSEKPEEPK